VKDVAYQEEVVRVLTNTLETGSVSTLSKYLLLSFLLLIFLTESSESCIAVPPHALLWSSRHWKNNYCPCNCPPAFWVSLFSFIFTIRRELAYL